MAAAVRSPSKKQEEAHGKWHGDPKAHGVATSGGQNHSRCCPFSSLEAERREVVLHRGFEQFQVQHEYYLLEKNYYEGIGAFKVSLKKKERGGTSESGVTGKIL